MKLSNLKTLALMCVSAFFSTPILYGEFSVNYTFALAVIILVFLRGKLTVPPLEIQSIIFILTLVLFASILSNPNSPHHERQILSFLTYSSVFMFCFLKLKEEAVLSLLMGVLLSGLVYSLNLISKVYLEFDVDQIDQLKNMVGSQRYGFVLLFSFWIVLLELRLKLNLSLLTLIPILAVLILGMSLTYSRTTILVLCFTLGIFTLLNIKSKKIIKLVFSLTGAFVALVSFDIINLPIGYYTKSLFEPLFNSGFSNSLLVETSSEGIRLLRLKEILNHTAESPFFGTGFLGYWAIAPIGSSAHSQYGDILLRTGLFGAFFYALTLVSTVVKTWKYSQSTFWALSSILCYSVFHETWKDSHGAYLMALIFHIAFIQTRKSADKNDII